MYPNIIKKPNIRMSIFVVGTESVFSAFLVLMPNQPSTVCPWKVDQQRDRLPYYSLDNIFPSLRPV